MTLMSLRIAISRLFRNIRPVLHVIATRLLELAQHNKHLKVVSKHQQIGSADYYRSTGDEPVSHIVYAACCDSVDAWPLQGHLVEWERHQYMVRRSEKQKQRERIT